MTRVTKIWTGLVVLLMLLVSVFLIKNYQDSFNESSEKTIVIEDSLKFNSMEWKKKREFYEDVRPYMLKDLMANVLFVGMDSSKVKNLLGETWGPHGSQSWDYRLGVYREIEASYLQIEFDKKGKLKQVKIIDR